MQVTRNPTRRPDAHHSQSQRKTAGWFARLRERSMSSATSGRCWSFATSSTAGARTVSLRLARRHPDQYPRRATETPRKGRNHQARRLSAPSCAYATRSPQRATNWAAFCSRSSRGANATSRTRTPLTKSRSPRRHAGPRHHAGSGAPVRGPDHGCGIAGDAARTPRVAAGAPGGEYDGIIASDRF